jgi:hypothetical protein
MTQSKNPLLNLIRGAETSKGYNDYSRYATVAPPKPVTQMTIGEVKAWQRHAARQGSKSVAIGGYQMITKTFNSVVQEMGLSDDEIFSEATQDSMGTHLLRRRGYDRWAAGEMSDEAFMDNLSMEWAALPRATGPKRGRSHYDRDGLNASRVGLDVVAQAFEAHRSGGDFDYAGQTNTSGSPTGRPMAGPAPAAVERQIKLQDVNPEENYTGADMGQVSSPLPRYVSNHDRKAAGMDTEVPSLWEGAGMAIDEGWIATNVMRQFNKEDFAIEEGFQISEELWEEVSADLPAEYQRAIGEATSEAHARALGNSLRESFQTDVKLNSMGWQGVGLRFGAAILDPVAIGVSLATEGTMAPVLLASKAGRLGRFLRAGTASAAVNAGLEGYLASQSPAADWERVGYAAAAGFVLGGAFGAVGRSYEDRQLGAAFNRVLDEVPDTRAAVPQGDTGFAGGSSAGAMQVPSQKALSVSEQVAEAAENAPRSALGKARIDNIGILKQSDNGVTRKLAGLLAEDGVGNADGTVLTRSASENVTKDMRVNMAKFYRVYNDAFSNWTKEQNMGLLQRLKPSTRGEFNRQVGMAVRREIDDTVNPHIRSVAVQTKKQLKEMLDFGREQNIRGFNDIKDNYNFLTRRHRIERLDQLVERYDTMFGHGKGMGKMNELVARSLMDSNKKWRNGGTGRHAATEALGYEDALEIAHAYLTSVRSRKYGSFDMGRALSGQDTETLEMMLLDAGMQTDQIHNIVTKVAHTRDAGTEGRMSSAKWRLDLDETTKINIIRPDGGKETLSIEDIIESDVEQLFTHYTRSVLGAGHLESALSEFKVRGPNGDMPGHAPSWETVKGYIADNSKLDQAKQAAEFRRLDNIYKAVKGESIEAPTGFREAQQILRDYNFLRIGGQLGVAQLAEIGTVLGNGGVRNLIKHMPALRKVFQAARKGEFSDDFFNEIEAIWGFGTDLTRHSPTVRFDDAHGGTFEAGTSGLQKVRYGLEQGKKVTSVTSGMAHVNMVLQRMNSRVLVQRFMDNANGGRKINSKRMAVMGISPEMAQRINAQLLSKVDETKGMLGRKVKRINIDQWDDIDAKNAFINGVDRWAKKSIQENDVGNMPNFMSYEMGKTMMQFRSFMVAAYTKQLLSGIYHRDIETFTSFAASMFFGGLFYAGQQVANAQGKADKEEWLEKRLAPEEIAKASFQRAGFSSFLPTVFDTYREARGLEPVFSYRTSGQSTGLVGQGMNPSLDFIMNAQKAVNGVTASLTNADYDFSQRDAQAVARSFFFNNAFVIRNGIQALTADLPKYSQ